MYLHPIFEVRGGSEVLDSLGSEIVDLAVRVSMDSAPGHAETAIKLGDRATGLSKDQKVVVMLGYAAHDSNFLTTVFTGTVDSISNTGPKTMVLSPLTKLYNLRRDRHYNRQTAGSIVKDLCTEAQIEYDTVAEGIRFPSYVVDRNKSAFEHIQELAKLCGCDVYATNEGKLTFKKYTPSTPHLLAYGKNILKIEKGDTTPAADSVRVAGSSPVGTKGEGKHHFLTKKSVESKTGSGSNEMLEQNMAIKDPETAKQVSDALQEKVQSVVNLSVKIIGDEKIMLGDTVEIEDVPDKSLNEQYQVREIEHVFSLSDGFVTTLICRAKTPNKTGNTSEVP